MLIPTDSKSPCLIFLSCCGPTGWCWGLNFFAIFAVPFQPVAFCCPDRLTKHYSLEINRDTVIYHSAINDCCCHIAYSKQTLALDKVNDVQIQAGCWETCFGLKKLQVESQGTEDIISAAIADPDLAREAILLATRQFRDRLVAPGAVGMSRGGGNMQARLNRLHEVSLIHTFRQSISPMSSTEPLLLTSQLVASNVMTSAEASKLKPLILAARQDPTEQLMEAQSLLKQGLLTNDEMAVIKQTVISHIN